MRKDRCFENLIGKASVFFASMGLCFALTGCADSLSDYLQANNLMNEGDHIGGIKKNAADASEGADADSIVVTDAAGSANADESNASADAESSASDAQNSDDQNQVADSENSGDAETETAKAEDSAASNTETENAGSEKSESNGTDAQNTTEEAASESGTFDPEKVNKAIDDLISKIEQETGRTGRRKDIEVENDEKGTDASTYYSDSFQQAQREAIGLSVVDIDEIKRSQAGNYAYEHLTEEGKTLYVELYKIIQNRAEDIVVSTLDEDVLDVVCQFVLADHPEFFYMDGYVYTRYSIGGVLKRISFTGNYIYSAEEIEARQAKIDEYVNTCLAGMPRDGDDYSKVKYVYDYLITNTEYDSSAPDNQNICSVFLYGKSVCQGYAKATQYLLNKAGVPTTMVSGKVKGVGHAWNLVYADGEYTYVDTTWGDSSYQRFETGGEESQKLPLINYTYLCCTTQDISKTHTISETLPMPECTSMKNNYYVREGEYFTDNDMNAIGQLFARRYADGSNNVTIKCSTSVVYDGFIQSLITDQKVFGYLEGSNNTVSVTRFDDHYILIIWLY